ncbi:MAG TPA: c-type cytochrome [Polyangiaceae bacterium]|nr:c-type cytochrome [Polyangiaceae bacterium]
MLKHRKSLIPGLLLMGVACSSGGGNTGMGAGTQMQAPGATTPTTTDPTTTPGVQTPAPGPVGMMTDPTVTPTPTVTPPVGTIPDPTSTTPPPTGVATDPGASCANYDAASGAPPPAFTNSCSSCHGATGEGKGYYPTIRSPTALAQIASAVRSGRVSTTQMITTAEGNTMPAQMPAFSISHVTDEDLAAITVYLSSTPTPVPAGSPYCLSRPEASWTPAQIDEAYQRGLTAWRTPGDVDNNACMSCHAADPMDLAALGYSDSQIYRRGFSHVKQAVLDDIVDMVHALRAKYNIAQPPDPAVVRPFQPGGEVLPGTNSSERDKAFGQELKTMGLTIMGPPINNAADAHKAWDELKAINLRTLKVGIPMNHYTEDKFNNNGAAPECPDTHMCDDHGTIADWITDTPVLTADKFAAVIPLQDAYLADPTLENLKALERALPRDDTSWFKNKFLAVQMANFLLRQQAGGMTNLDGLGATPFPVDNGYLYNSIWMVGANQRDFIHNVGDALPTGGGKFSVPQATLAGLTRNNAKEQLQRIIVPWFWLGFTFDPSTMNVEPDYVAEGDEYFTQETWLDAASSPIHAAFIVSKRSIEMMAYDTLPRSPNVFPFFHPDLGRFPVTPMTMRSGYFPVLTNFAEEKNFNTINNYQLDKQPTDPEQRALYQTYTANMYRMFMWVLIDELQTTPQIWNPNILEGKIHKAELFLTSSTVDNPNLAQDTAMLAQARMLKGSATVMQGN